jgi:alpha-1,2-mannosyltransferase
VAQRERKLSPVAWQVPVVVAFWGAVGLFVALASARHGFFDLKVYYGAINFWADGHGELYDYLQGQTGYGFTYPPFAALAMLPMAAVPWPAAIAISLVATVSVSVVVLHWLVDPIIRRRGWSRWFVLAIVVGMAAAFEPMRDTVNFGQVNMLLVFLVVADLLVLVRQGRPAAGIGIGVATAIKLTPGVFILYLLVTRRFKVAAVAMASAAVATLAAAAIIPDASREFWTDALWNTNRIGAQDFISNQSLNGFVARLHPTDPSRPLWLVLALITLAVWGFQVRRAVKAGDEVAGLAFTGIAGCLLSPITWVHHLVWMLPALVLMFDRGLDLARPRWQRRLLLGVGLVGFVLLCSRVVWDYSSEYPVIKELITSAYVWAGVVLLVVLPSRGIGSADGGPEIPDLLQAESAPAGDVQAEERVQAVSHESAPLVEAASPKIGLENP